MEQNKKDTGKILFKKDYLLLIENISDETNPEETILNLLTFYKVENPSFMENLLIYSRYFVWGELNERIAANDLTSEEYDELHEICSHEFAEDSDLIKIQNAEIKTQQLALSVGRKSKSKENFWGLVYLQLYLVILKLYKDSCTDINVDSTNNEKIKEILTVQEKLYLLDILYGSGELKSISDKVVLRKMLSLIMGINENSLDKPLKKHSRYFDAVFVGKKELPGSLGSRRESLQKLDDILVKGGLEKSEPLKKIRKIESSFDLAISKIKKT